MNSFSFLKLTRFSKLIISVLIIKYIDTTSLHCFPNDCEVRNESPEISRNLSATEFSNAGYAHVAVSLTGTQLSVVETAPSQGQAIRHMIWGTVLMLLIMFVSCVRKCPNSVLNGNTTRVADKSVYWLLPKALRAQCGLGACSFSPVPGGRTVCGPGVTS